MSGQSLTLTIMFLDKLSSGSLPVLSVHSFAIMINRQLLFLNQRKRKNGCRNIFMTKSSQKNVLNIGVDLRS